MATDLGKASAGPGERVLRPRGAHAAAKSGRGARHTARDTTGGLRALHALFRPDRVPAPPAVSTVHPAPARTAVASVCAVALVAVVVPLAVLQIPDAIAWSLPAPFTVAGPNALASLLRGASLTLPAMAVAAPFGALAARRFRAEPVLLAGLLAIGAADLLGQVADTVLLIGADRLLHGLGAGISLVAMAAIVAERSQATRSAPGPQAPAGPRSAPGPQAAPGPRSALGPRSAIGPRSLAGVWACAMVCALAAAPSLIRCRVTAGGWHAALQPFPWLVGTALALAALHAILTEGTARAARTVRTAVRSAFPATERALLALLAAPVAGMCALSVAVTYQNDRAVVAAAIADAITLAGLAVMVMRASTAGRLAAVCAVTGFTVAPAAGVVTALVPPAEVGPQAGCAMVAAAVCGAALALTQRSSQSGRARTQPGSIASARTQPGSIASARTQPSSTVSATISAGLAVAAAAFGAAYLAGPAVTHALVLSLLCVPLTGGLAAALAAALRGTGTGAAVCAVVLLLAGVVSGYLAAGAVQLQALQGVRTTAAVQTALVATMARWALIAAAVTGAAALAVATASRPRAHPASRRRAHPAATAPGPLVHPAPADSGAPPVRRAGGIPDRG